jgi:hypothetical protein
MREAENWSQEEIQEKIVEIQDVLADWQESIKYGREERFIYTGYLMYSEIPEIQAALDENTKKQLSEMRAYVAKAVPLEMEKANKYYSTLGNSLKNRELGNLIARVNSNEGYEAICLVQGIAHDYKIEFEIIQTKEGCSLTGITTDFGEAPQATKLDLDLLKELQNLRNEQPKLRVTLP